uniref:Uncharacterized protein n=1 Tax=Arundo donax TaxID=35708 RepID=A0A0A8YA37_ARUDO
MKSLAGHVTTALLCLGGFQTTPKRCSTKWYTSNHPSPRPRMLLASQRQ